jgi:hypothetical protein
MRIGYIQVHHAWLLLVPWVAFTLGVAMNAGVVGANHGLMPVQMHECVQAMFASTDALHTCMTPATHLNFFADWIVINTTTVMSLGDFLEIGASFMWQFCFGAWMMAQCIGKDED